MELIDFFIITLFATYLWHTNYTLLFFILVLAIGKFVTSYVSNNQSANPGTKVFVAEAETETDRTKMVDSHIIYNIEDGATYYVYPTIVNIVENRVYPSNQSHANTCLISLAYLEQNDLYDTEIYVKHSHRLNGPVQSAIFQKPGFEEMNGVFVPTGEAIVGNRKIKYWSGPQ